MQISSDDWDRINKLPAWARDIIKRLKSAPDVMAEEIARYRRENANLQERAKRVSEANEAIINILQCAGRGGNDFAAAVVSVLEGYEIFQKA